MLLYKPKKNQNAEGNRLLIITVLGSASPIRFLVNEDEPDDEQPNPKPKC